MKINIKKEKQAMIEEIMPRLGFRPGTDTYKTIQNDLLKLRHISIFALRNIATGGKKK